MPPPLLKGMELGELAVEDFLRLLAKARYIQELEAAIVQRGVVDVFKE